MGSKHLPPTRSHIICVQLLVLGRHHAGAMGDLLANALTRAGEERSMRRENMWMGEAIREIPHHNESQQAA